MSASWRTQVREWLLGLQRDVPTDAGEIAQRSRVAPATVYRMLNPESAHEPSMASVLRIAEAFGVDPPGGGGASSFREADAKPYEAQPLEEFRPTTPDQSLWRVETRALELAGVLPGDLLLLDAGEQPRPGDVVIAQMYDFDRGSAQIRIRYFDGAFLTVRTMDPSLAEQPVSITSAVRIVGPIRAISRRLR